MTAPLPPGERRAGEVALRTILVYKLVKGMVLVAAGAVLSGAILFGLGPSLRDHAAHLYAHATRAWALHLADALAKLTSAKWLRWSAVALELDGTINLVEAWALEKRHPWGPWLVVVVTALLLPFEVRELWRHPRPSRVLLLVGNLAVLVFLAWYARRHAASLGPKSTAKPAR